jgi:hypothetical protein
MSTIKNARKIYKFIDRTLITIIYPDIYSNSDYHNHPYCYIPNKLIDNALTSAGQATIDFAKCWYKRYYQNGRAASQHGQRSALAVLPC